MYIVMVEFDVAADTTDRVIDTVRGLLSDLVRHQDGFQHARLHREAGGAKVVNYMQWESKDALDAFRAANKDRIGQAVGQFGPKFTFFEVVQEVDHV